MENIKSKNIYEVYTNSIFFDVDQMTLTHLYQPIIGPIAISLYLVLLTEANNIRYTLIHPSHTRLLNILNISIYQFVEAKNKLEAIGLLKTYANKFESSEDINYIYILYPPKTPKTFINTTYLANKLKNILGELDFDRTVFFLTQKLPNITKFIDISKKYDEVFIKEENKDNEIKSNNDILNRDKQIIEYDIIKQLNDLFIKNNLDYQILTGRQKDMILKIIEDTNISINNLFLAIEALIKNKNSITYKQIIKSLEVNLLLNNFMKNDLVEENISKKFLNKKTVNDENNEDSNLLYKSIIEEGKNLYEEFDYEFITNPNVYEFFNQLVKKSLSTNDNQKLEQLLDNMAPEVINCLIYYIYNKQGKINWNYIIKVANTITKNGTNYDFDSTKDFLDKVIK